MWLKISVAPSHVTISGPTEARVGDPVPLTCTTANSNPPAEIKWMVGGRQVRNATSRTVVSPEGGWITTSNITAVVEPNRRSLVVICHGLNMQLTENVVSTHTINVLCKFYCKIAVFDDAETGLHRSSKSTLYPRLYRRHPRTSRNCSENFLHIFRRKSSCIFNLVQKRQEG